MGEEFGHGLAYLEITPETFSATQQRLLQLNPEIAAEFEKNDLALR